MKHIDISKLIVFFYLSLNFNFFLPELLQKFVPSPMSPSKSGCPAWRYIFHGVSPVRSFCAQWGGCIYC